MEAHRLVSAVLVLRTPSEAPSLQESAMQVAQDRNPWTYERFVETYSATPEDIDAVEHFVRFFGMSVKDTNPVRRTMTIEGTAIQMAEAFGAAFFECRGPGSYFVAYDDDMSLPAHVAGIIICIFGIGGARLALPARRAGLTRAFSQPPLGAVKAALPVIAGSQDGPWNSYFPRRFAEYYQFPLELTGEGVTVGILELGGGFTTDDMERFFSAQGMSMPEIVTVGPNVPATGGDAWLNFEVTMDVQILASCAPAARHVVYFSDANSSGWMTSYTVYDLLCMSVFDRVNKPAVLSLSAGFPELLSSEGITIWTKPEMNAVDEVLASAAILGITVCVASGDSGSFYPVGQMMFSAPSLLYFPGSSPWALCCGGTTLGIAGGEVVDEVVWNRLSELAYFGLESLPTLSNLGSSTGGVSVVFEMPPWQAQAGVPEKTMFVSQNLEFGDFTSFRGRGCPDVAANADLLVGYKVFIHGRWRYGGGTSASCPFIASLMALICQGVKRERIGFVNGHLYRLQLESKREVFRTITKGNNGGYSAAEGRPWNACTGLGSPRGAALLAAMKEIYGPTGEH
ncbi:S53 family peptidase [Sorangium sp. So ce1335]|uniref:S53 family peptidase n=1 Tax=Sorangium sp. So ce1335 TaxID=3133335 RepID=UPI003F6466D5